jgi:hypothetical protein
MFSNPKKVRPEEPQSDNESEYSSESSESGYSSEAVSEKEAGPQKESYEDRQKIKQDLLIKIQALQEKGFEFSKKFNMTSNMEEMLFEYNKIKKFIESQASIKFSRRCLMACVTGLEFLNKKFDPFKIKLDGWSENVMEDISNYDNIFEKLHEKYSKNVEVAPEIELLLTLGGSAFMFHLTNSLLKSPMMESMPIAQNNPNFMASMMSAMSQGMKEAAKPPNFKAPGQGFPAPMETRELRKEMKGPSIDPGLFNGTALASNYPGFQPNAPHPQHQHRAPPPPSTIGSSYFDDDPINDDDRYSIGSSDSSLSEVSLGSTVKRVAVKPVAAKRGGKGGKGGGKGGGFELNIK